MSRAIILDSLSRERANLKSLMKKNIVKDPALFWAGRMSIQVDTLRNGSLSDFSEHFSYLLLLKSEYDKVIFARTGDKDAERAQY